MQNGRAESLEKIFRYDDVLFRSRYCVVDLESWRGPIGICFAVQVNGVCGPCGCEHGKRSTSMCPQIVEWWVAPFICRLSCSSS